MSALIVEVPDAEPIVGEHRQRWDTSAALGVPAHVTVLFPFMHPSDIDNSVCEELADVSQPIDSSMSASGGRTGSVTPSCGLHPTHQTTFASSQRQS